MNQRNPSQHTAITRISPVRIITANWLISIHNQPDYISLTESGIRFRYKGKLAGYIESYMLMPKQTSYQINEFYWALEKVSLEILNLGLKERNAQRPEYMLPQIQLAIERTRVHWLRFTLPIYSAEFFNPVH